MIPFIDLKSQQKIIRTQIDAAIKKVLDHGKYIMGPEVFELEEKLAKFCGVKFAITCSSGTDALLLGLMAKGVKVGDAVFVPSFTFAATAEVIVLLGATPVFIDSFSDTYNMDVCSLDQGIKKAKNLGLNPVGVIPVDLFGQPADYDSIQTVSDNYNLWIMADGAQSLGATYKGQSVGSIGDMATTSFFPAKPLGCYGDGGAIFTNDDELAGVITSLRVHGKGSNKYDNKRIGMNGRLDTIQAAILIEKLKIFSDELIIRQKVAEVYSEALRDVVGVPLLPQNLTSAWAQYTVKLPEEVNRDDVIEKLKDVGVPSVVYYVKPLHLQSAYQKCPISTRKGLPVCENLAKTVLSLPMSGYLSKEQINIVMEGVKNGLER